MKKEFGRRKTSPFRDTDLVQYLSHDGKQTYREELVTLKALKNEISSSSSSIVTSERYSFNGYFYDPRKFLLIPYPLGVLEDPTDEDIEDLIAMAQAPDYMVWVEKMCLTGGVATTHVLQAKDQIMELRAALNEEEQNITNRSAWYTTHKDSTLDGLNNAGYSRGVYERLWNEGEAEAEALLVEIDRKDQLLQDLNDFYENLDNAVNAFNCGGA